ncbi:hypothetical protein ACFFGV_03150 [Pontibacillus salicampi]|uniref:DUF4190 domain-containing protein n=1 Tax=Pontibacillus salicampi TaxID=1449801 RepID=A0ABV6LJQ2_9BACI
MEHEDKDHVEEAPQYGKEKESELKAVEHHELDAKLEEESKYSLAESQSLYAGTDDVEIAQEAAADINHVRDPIKSDERESDMQSEVQTGFGWLAVILAVVSFFVLPVVLGAAGIVLGFMSKRRGADTLGNTAIAAGAISIVLTLFFAPFS